MINIDRNDETLHFREDNSEFSLKSEQFDLMIE